MKQITIADVRENLSELIELVAGGNQSFIVTKFGKPKAQIVPIPELSTKKYAQNLLKISGNWFSQNEYSKIRSAVKQRINKHD